MLKHGVRELVAIFETGKLTGLDTMTDMIRWISDREGNPAYLLKYLSGSIRDRTS